MLVCGVICEYDPFHNGHAYHLRAVREKTGCDYIVCAMSGHFTQRGRAALLDKWARARMALLSGADAVFELPALFAVRDAERFARGGVALLHALGVVTHLGFGSETGELAKLFALARAAEAPETIRRGLAKGQTLARARGEAMGFSDGAPNDALAVEYVKAIDRFARGMEPVAIRRLGGGYHDPAMGGMASATAVRAALSRGEDVSGAMPEAAHAVLRERLSEGACQQEGALDTALLFMLRTMTPEGLRRIADVGEGLENRLLRAAQTANGREDLLKKVKCKRYTYARLSRILTQALLGLTRELADENPLPAYARLLGFRRQARPLLAEISKRASVPVVTRAAKFLEKGGAPFALDVRAGDVWALGVQADALRGGRRDLTQRVLIVES